jgi:hypothetical protein
MSESRVPPPHDDDDQPNAARPTYRPWVAAIVVICALAIGGLIVYMVGCRNRNNEVGSELTLMQPPPPPAETVTITPEETKALQLMSMTKNAVAQRKAVVDRYESELASMRALLNSEVNTIKLAKSGKMSFEQFVQASDEYSKSLSELIKLAELRGVNTGVHTCFTAINGYVVAEGGDPLKEPRPR